MFSNESENYKMLFGAYKKLKSYYHYNKNYLFMRQKLAEFEYDAGEMDSALKNLAKILKKPTKYKKVIYGWIESIDYYVLPKTFSEDKSTDERFVTSSPNDRYITKVHFFIDMPIELYLLETVWTLFLAKIAQDNNIINESSYGNAIDNNVLFDSSVDGLKESIRFQKNKMFKIYFPQYCDWKNNAISAIEDNRRDKDMVLVSLDIKSFFYSVPWKFDMLADIIHDSRLEELASLTRIISLIYKEYTTRISKVRQLSPDLKDTESILPIGLFSSMVIANIYLAAYDAGILDNNKVLYYGRYVDDILLVLDVSQTGFSADDMGLENLLINDNAILSWGENDNNVYTLYGYSNLVIQREKLKVVSFEHGKSEGIISQLSKSKVNMIPSQMNIIPKDDFHMVDFEEAAYALDNFSTETKIREMGQLEIDNFKLSSHMAELVRKSKYGMALEERSYEEEEKVINFFSGSNAIEYNTNWINALYFVFLSSKNTNRRWNLLERRIRDAIRDVRINHLEDIRKGKSAKVKAKMKKDLDKQLDICISTVLAIYPLFSLKERREIIELCHRIRSANLFNHYLVSFPLMNYSDNVGDDINLSNMTLSSLKEKYFCIKPDSRKIELSPRFIYFEEFAQYSFIRNIVVGESGIPKTSAEDIDRIWNTFIRANQIDSRWARSLSITFKEEKEPIEGYFLNRIVLLDKYRSLSKIRIAVASIKLDIEECCMGLNDTPVIRNRMDFISFLSASYNGRDDKVDYLVFPEFYLPISWIQDVLSFVRKTGVTVISGLQYICRNEIAKNTIGVFARVKSGKYNSAFLFAREKNDYAPLEKKLLATEGYLVKDQDAPHYTLFDDGMVKFGIFLCYEFTDILSNGALSAAVLAN